MIPFVLSVYPEPKGFGSLFATHATHPPHSPREKFGVRCPAWLITSEVGHTKTSWRGTVEGGNTRLLCTWPLWCFFFFLGLLFFADRSLLTKGGGWAGGVGIWSALKWKLKQTCVQTSLSSLFSLPLSVGACGGQRSDAGMLAFIHM